ncbi:MAG: hypothetical protein SOH56_10345 [Lentilactobacillus sunkii]
MLTTMYPNSLVVSETILHSNIKHEELLTDIKPKYLKKGWK